MRTQRHAAWLYGLLVLAPDRSPSAAMGRSASAGAPQRPPVGIGAQPAVPGYDAALAKQLGADERGMRSYVLVLLKTGPSKMPAGAERDKMFKGHFANIDRLAAEGKLVLAGPSDGADGWRGIFVLATNDIEEAKRYVASDPVIMQGKMVAEYHKFYGSAGLMLVNETHAKLQKP